MNERSLMSGNIVIVDDNPSNLRVLGEMLQQVGCKVRQALNGELALQSIDAQPPELVLLDVRMPGMDGYEVCAQLKTGAHTRDIPIIFISALHDTEDKVRAFQAGGVDFITKPFQMEEVLARVWTHLRLYRMQRNLETVVAEHTAALRDSYDSILESERRYQSILDQTIQAIALMVEKRDPYTAGHQQRVAELATVVARRMGMDPGRIEGVRLGAMIHDIGKINVPAEILSHPGRLDDNKFSMIKTHCEVGYDIIKDVNFPWPVAQLILQHHERLDGTGYPHGLQGDAIIQEARIVAVVDVVEAMASHRPYRPALGLAAAVAEIEAGGGVRYDAACVEILVDLVAKGKIAMDASGNIVFEE